MPRTPESKSRRASIRSAKFLCSCKKTDIKLTFNDATSARGGASFTYFINHSKTLNATKTISTRCFRFRPIIAVNFYIARFFGKRTPNALRVLA